MAKIKNKNNTLKIKLNMDFILWLLNIEKIVKRKTGFKLTELPDEPYYEMYMMKAMPTDVANLVISVFEFNDL